MTQSPTLETTIRLQALVDALPDAVALVAQSGAILGSNAAWRALEAEAMGASSEGAPTPDERWPKAFAALFGGAPDANDAHDAHDAREALIEGFRAVVAGDRPRFDFDHVYERAGEERCLSLVLSPFQAVEGEPRAVLLQARRATEPLARRRVEAELREVSERHQRFMVATSEAVCLIDSGRIIEANPAAIRLLGRTEEQMIGLDVMELPPPEDREEVMQRLTANQPGVYDVRLMRGDGTWFYAELSATPVPYKGRMIRGTAARDVTQRTLAEMSVRESEERFRLLSDISSEGVVLTDAGTLIDANVATTELLGFTREELIGRSVLDLIEPQFRDEVRRAIVTNRDTPYEINAVHKDGTRIPVLVRGRVLPHRGRVIRGTTLRDLRLQRQMDEALRERVAQEAQLAAQAAALAELSTPLIPISASTVIMPLIGAIDNHRAARVVETLLRGVSGAGASSAILDITGVPTVDSYVADALVRAARAVRLIGAEVVLTGIRPEVARTLVAMGADLTDIPTRGTLEGGIIYARSRDRGAPRGSIRRGGHLER